MRFPSLSPFARLSALQFLVYAGMGSSGVFLSLYLREALATSDGEGTLYFVGFVLFIQSLVGIAAAPVAGYLADRFKIENRILAVCAAFVAVSAMLLLGLSSSAFTASGLGKRLALAMAAIVLNGLFLRPIVPLIDTETLEYLHGATGASTGYGSIRLYGSVGWFVFTLMVGLVLQATGRLNLSLVFYAGVFILLALMVSGGFRAKIQPVRIPWEHLKKDRMYQLFLVFVFIVVFATSGSFAFTGYMMQEAKASYFVIGFAFAVGALPEIPVFRASSGLLRRFGNRVLIPVGVLIIAAKLAWFITLPRMCNPWLFAFAQCIHGIGWAFFFSGLINLLDRQTHPDIRAMYQSLMSMVMTLAAAASGLAAGIVFELFGSSTLMALDTLILVAALIFFRFFVKGHAGEGVRAKVGETIAA